MGHLFSEHYTHATPPLQVTVPYKGHIINYGRGDRHVRQNSPAIFAPYRFGMEIGDPPIWRGLDFVIPPPNYRGCPLKVCSCRTRRHNTSAAFRHRRWILRLDLTSTCADSRQENRNRWQKKEHADFWPEQTLIICAIHWKQLSCVATKILRILMHQPSHKWDHWRHEDWCNN